MAVVFGTTAVVGVLLAQMSTRRGGHTIPTEAGFRTGLLIGCAVSVLAALVALAIPARKLTSALPETTDLEPAAAGA
ncbi:hypothetical protein [Nocardia beijingensis]|uniref:hypothetical protein n=1 Tax=Nocardia beijingensis TaxID=95162 RepID=UPI003D9EF9CD